MTKLAAAVIVGIAALVAPPQLIGVGDTLGNHYWGRESEVADRDSEKRSGQAILRLGRTD